MHNIKINGYFKNDDMNTIVNYDCYGEKMDNKIKFENDDDIITITVENELILFQRENEEIIMTYEFSLKENTTNNSYKLKKENLSVNFEIKTTQMINNSSKIFIEFNLIEMDGNCSYQLSLDYKVV